MVGRLRLLTVQLGGTEEPAFAIDEGDDPALANAAADSVTFPIPDTLTVDGNIRPIINEAVRVDGHVVGVSGLDLLAPAAQMGLAGET